MNEVIYDESARPPDKIASAKNVRPSELRRRSYYGAKVEKSTLYETVQDLQIAQKVS